MSDIDLANLREQVDEAIYEYVKACGHDPQEFDYSEFNELLDSI